MSTVASPAGRKSFGDRRQLAHERLIAARQSQELSDHVLVRVRPSGSRYPEHMSRLERITVDPAVCHGQPVVRGMRYPVQSLLELLASGMTIEEVLADYPDLEREDLLAALEFGALTAGGHRVVPLGTE